MNKTELLKRAINTYGVQAQKDMMIEEMSELTIAILKERRVTGLFDREIVRENIREEMADVQIMLDQMRIIYGDCLEWHDRKLQRLNDRLDKVGGSCE